MDGNSVLQNSVFAEQTWAGLVWSVAPTTEATDVLCHRGKSTRVSFFQYVEIHLMFMELCGCSWSALRDENKGCRWGDKGLGALWGTKRGDALALNLHGQA